MPSHPWNYCKTLVIGDGSLIGGLDGPVVSIKKIPKHGYLLFIELQRGVEDKPLNILKTWRVGEGALILIKSLPGRDQLRRVEAKGGRGLEVGKILGSFPKFIKPSAAAAGDNKKGNNGLPQPVGGAVIKLHESLPSERDQKRLKGVQLPILKN